MSASTDGVNEGRQAGLCAWPFRRIREDWEVHRLLLLRCQSGARRRVAVDGMVERRTEDYTLSQSFSQCCRRRLPPLSSPASRRSLSLDNVSAFAYGRPREGGTGEKITGWCSNDRAGARRSRNHLRAAGFRATGRRRFRPMEPCIPRQGKIACSFSPGGTFCQTASPSQSMRRNPSGVLSTCTGQSCLGNAAQGPSPTAKRWKEAHSLVGQRSVGSPASSPRAAGS